MGPAPCPQLVTCGPPSRRGPSPASAGFTPHPTPLECPRAVPAPGCCPPAGLHRGPILKASKSVWPSRATAFWLCSRTMCPWKAGPSGPAPWPPRCILCISEKMPKVPNQSAVVSQGGVLGPGLWKLLHTQHPGGKPGCPLPAAHPLAQPCTCTTFRHLSVAGSPLFLS